MNFDVKYTNFKDGLTMTEPQIEGVDFLITHPYAILSFQTGLGKTATSLTSMQILLDRYVNTRGVIICPVKAVKVFKKELIKKLGYKAHEIGLVTNQDMEYDTKTNKVFIFTHTSLEKYCSLIDELNVRFKLIVIMDEAHILQDPKSKIYQKMVELRPSFKVVWLSTATPVLNDLESLYNIVAYLDPKFFGSKTSFCNTYMERKLKTLYIKGGRKKKVWDLVGYKNLDQLKKRIENICIVRQIKYNLKFANINAKLTDEEEKFYEKISTGIVMESAETKTFSERMHDLQRLVDNSLDEEYVSVTHSTKETLLIDTIKKIMDQKLSVIIYVDYHDTVDRIEQVLNEKKDEINFRKLHKITGKVDLATREAVEDDIDERDIIIITSAGSESINLQRANCILFYDIPYSIKTIIQVIGRVCRMDTKFKFQYIFMMYTLGTIDEYKYLLFNDNANMVIQVLGTDANMPMDLQEIDKKNLNTLRDKLLWHYKDYDGREARRKKRVIKKNIVAIKTQDVTLTIGDYFINMNPESYADIPNTSRIKRILPDDYAEVLNQQMPLSILKNRYVDKIKSSKEIKQVMSSIVDSALNKGKTVVLFDDFGIAEVLRDYIIDNVKL